MGFPFQSTGASDKLNRMNVAVSFLARNKANPFLDQLVIGDEKWILYNNVQRKRTWKKVDESAESVAKAGLHPMKILLCVWWDCREIIHFELRGETITADKYCKQLTRLDVAIRERRPVLANQKGIIFHHDNARPHVGQQTLRKLQELQWEILQHPPYSPDIAPSVFHLFPSLQNSLNSKNLMSEESVKNHLTNFFQEKPSSFFKNGIDKLVDR
ncbi:histone-lysine N-methyltransferase SETMAR-like [Anoplolepis gracilipes]|uniref:histone-lysine N-methyltransferase SETMAR-like n=1 Tax=Anoplolepis gracilipes TaxID=354296 RepID=UPI003BA1EFDA